MFDVTFLIPDYPDGWDDGSDCVYTPPDPEEVIPEHEKNRLFEDLCRMIDTGAFLQE